MVSEGNVSTTVAQLTVVFSRLSNKFQPIVLVVGATIAIYLVWLFWRFALRPVLKPLEPPVLPYWIPVIGHAVAMFRNQEALLRYGRERFHGQPFTLVVAGQTIYVQASVDDIAATYRNNTTISYYQSVEEIMSSWGISKDGLAKLWKLTRGESDLNPQGKSFGILSHDIRRAQMEAPQGLNEITDRFEKLLDPYICPDGIPKACVVNQGPGGATIVSLMRLCQFCVIPAGTEAFFGHTLRSVCPELDQAFVAFDKNSWQLLFQLPPLVAKDMHAAKTFIIDALAAYSAAPPSEKEDALWMTRMHDSEMEAIGLATSDQAIVHFMIYWLINVNSYKLSFWMFAFILSSPSILTVIQKEINSFPSDSPEATDPTLSFLIQSCPTLNAVFYEALRITVSAASTRTVLSDTVLNGRTYKAGAKILIPYRQLHFSEDTFGPAPYTFDHTRFLEKKGNLSRSPQFKPFGGGRTLCTGRFVARREVILMVARVLGRFDVELCENQTWPEMDMLKPGLGVMEPKEGQDLKVRLHKRR